MPLGTRMLASKGRELYAKLICKCKTNLKGRSYLEVEWDSYKSKLNKIRGITGL